MRFLTFIASLKRLRKFGLTIWLTDLLYDRGKQLFSYKNYIRLMNKRDYAIERYILTNIPRPRFNNPPYRSKQQISNYPIWFMWLQGESDMPDIVKLCYRSAIKYCREGKLILITKDNINLLVELD